MFHVIVLDTSFLVSFYLTHDVNHEPALKLAEENNPETMLLSEVILFETLTVLNYKGDLQLANEAYSELMANKQIRFFHFTELEKDEITELFFKQNVKLSFPDVSVVYLAKKSKSKVLAFDEKIMKALKIG